MKTNKPLVFLALIVILMSIVSCGSSKVYTAQEKASLEKLVTDKNFEIELQWARPLATNSLNQLFNAGLFRPGDNASQINLQGNGNIVKFENDTVSANLPYYGERQMGGGYNSAGGGIDFKSTPKDLRLTKDDDKDYYLIEFNVKDQDSNENYDVSLTVYPSLNAVINIWSSQRNTIQYNGTLRGVTEPKKDKRY
jgi:hypothetical protein